MHDKNEKILATLRTPEEVRNELSVRGIAISAWARQSGYSPSLVLQVLSGRLKCERGQSHQIAVALGLKKGLLENVADLPFERQRRVNTRKQTNSKT